MNNRTDLVSSIWQMLAYYLYLLAEGWERKVGRNGLQAQFSFPQIDRDSQHTQVGLRLWFSATALHYITQYPTDFVMQDFITE